MRLDVVAVFDWMLTRREIRAHYLALSNGVHLPERLRRSPWTKSGLVKVADDGEYHHVVITKGRRGARTCYIDGEVAWRNFRARLLRVWKWIV